MNEPLFCDVPFGAGDLRRNIGALQGKLPSELPTAHCDQFRCRIGIEPAMTDMPTKKPPEAGEKSRIGFRRSHIY